MAKKKNRPSQKGKRTKVAASAPQSNAAKAVSRRGLVQYGVIGAAILAGGGYFGVRSVAAAIGEADLTKIGNGTPAVVQVHDPGCPICNALQREARKALKAMDGDKPEYLVANITTAEGSTFAADHGVPHVTILTFDAKGALQQVLRGPQTRDQLQPVFENLMGRAARS